MRPHHSHVLFVTAILVFQAPTPAASVVRTCAPWDGAAVAVYLTAVPIPGAFPEPPFRSIIVYRSLADVLGHKFTLSPVTTRDGVGQECTQAGKCRTARAAMVEFAQPGADSTVDVTWRLDFGPGEIVSGRTRARLRGDRVMCG